MAEFQNVVRELQRMCKNGCADCPIRSAKEGIEPFCSKWMKKYSAETERIIMQWAREHPLKTNGMKFKEVFGDHVVWESNEEMVAWLNAEYKGVQDEK